MKKIELSAEELEMMNYNDIAHVILENVSTKMRITDLFKEVGNILGMDEGTYETHIADFFELLSTDKRFIMLEDGFWDLKIKHNKGMESFDEEDDSEEDIIIEEDESGSDDEIFDDSMKASDDDVDDDDLSDLVIVDDIEDDSN